MAFDVSAGPVRKELSGWKPSKCGSGGGGVADSCRRWDPWQNAVATLSRCSSTFTSSARRSPMAATASGRLPASMAMRTASSKPSTAASVRPSCLSRRLVMTTALGLVGSRSTTAAIQRSAASTSSASSRVRARSIGFSVVGAPGRSGGEARMTSVILHQVTRCAHSSSDPRRPPSDRSMNSLIASAVAVTRGTTRG